MTAATPAQVAAAQEALGCERETMLSEHGVEAMCSEHWDGHPEWSDRGCPVAVQAADAVVAAGPDPAKVAADALREAADAWQSGEGITVMTARGTGIPAIDYAQRTLDWLRARLDRIEAGQ